MYVQAYLYNEAPHLTRTRHGFSFAVYAANKKWFQKLPLETAQVFRSAYMKPRDAFDILSRQTDKQLTLLQRAGLKVHDLSANQRELWQTTTNTAVYQILEQIGGQAQELYDLILEGKQAYVRNGEALINP
tara:strand:- start:136 stop:528 length:393 start_codon:yes stop_codon:yes gene_type:complete